MGYYRFLGRTSQVIAIAIAIVSAMIAVCILADWIWHPGWGYPWYSLPIVSAGIAFGWFLRKFMATTLRQH